MSSEYFDIYEKRLNRYGTTLQTRIQGEREREFENYLKKTVYYVEFLFDGNTLQGSLEPYKQDYTKTQAYLLLRIDVTLAAGTILMIPNKDGENEPWMIWWLESMKASGYNRYLVLHLNHQINWQYNGVDLTQWAYFYGPGTTRIQNTKFGKLQYAEDDNIYMFITTTNEAFKREDYFEVVIDGIKRSFVVTDLDITSTPGVCYISVDPVYNRDHSTTPYAADNFWLNGGK